jgi:hypothetical protein
MRQLVLIGLLVLGGAVTAACAPAASDAELQAMCGNLVTLRGEVDTTTMEERTAKIEEDFAKRAQLHKDQQAAAERGAQADLEGRLEEAGDDAEAKERIEKEGAARKTELAKEGAELEKKIAADKQAAITAAGEKAEAAKVAFDEAVAECVEGAKKEGTTQAVAQCRAKAESTDAYWNQCR